jgi:hypothetical protein
VSLKIHRYPDLAGPFYHYNNTVVLWFSPKHWLYLREWPNGEFTDIGGVTGTLKIVDKSAALIGWSTRLFLEKAIALVQEHRRGNFVEVEYDDLVSLLTYSREEHKRVLEAAGDTGHSAHAFVESLMKATMAEDESRRLEILAKFPEDDRATNAAVAAVCFLADHNVRYIQAEQRVYSLEYNVAGTMDGDVLIDSCEGDHGVDCPCRMYPKFKDKRVVLDLKTSNAIQGVYFAQASLYRKAKEEEFPDIKFDGTVILRLGKDDRSEFEPWFSFGDAALEAHLVFFKRCLDLKESVKDTDDQMRAFREVRKERVKAAKLELKAAQDKIRCPKADDYKGSRMTKCLPDGTQCEACAAIYLAKHPKG